MSIQENSSLWVSDARGQLWKKYCLVAQFLHGVNFLVQGWVQVGFAVANVAAREDHRIFSRR